MLVTLKDILKEMTTENFAVAGFNVFGYEDATMVVQAAEELKAPVILMANRDALKHMPIEIIGKILITLSKQSSIPVCIHLDHAKSVEEIVSAIKVGFSSVMYDGSDLSIEDNIKKTKEIAYIAHQFGVSIEAEVGCVGYSSPDSNVKSMYTDPNDVKRFVKETDVDALAVSIGNLHRMEIQKADLQYNRLKEIENLVDIPLVMHGSTGIKDEDLKKLVTYKIGKINIGTALRMAFGNTMRLELENNPQEFDRIKIFNQPMEEVKKVAMQKMKVLGWGK